MPSAFLTLVLGPHLTPPSPSGLLRAFLPFASASFVFDFHSHTLSPYLSFHLSPETTTHHLTSYYISSFQTTTQFFLNSLIQFIRSYSVLCNQSNTKSWPSKWPLPICIANSTYMASSVSLPSLYLYIALRVHAIPPPYRTSTSTSYVSRPGHLLPTCTCVLHPARPPQPSHSIWLSLSHRS